MDALLILLLLIVLIQSGIIVGLYFYVKQLKKRPDFAVFKELQKEATKAQKDRDGLQRAFDTYRASNGRDRIILDAKEAIDADALMILVAKVLTEGDGAAGNSENVAALIQAIYGEIPSTINQFWYNGESSIAVWNGRPRVPKSLDKIIGGD